MSRRKPPARVQGAGGWASIEFYRRNPSAFFRDEILEREGTPRGVYSREALEALFRRGERKLEVMSGPELKALYAGKAIYAGEWRLPVIRTPSAYVVAHADADATPPTVEDLKRIKALVVSDSAGPFTVARAPEQLKREAGMDLMKIQNPEISETEILREQLKHVSRDRNDWERRAAVHRVREEKLEVGLEKMSARLERKDAENAVLGDLIAQAYGSLLNNHRTARKLHQTPGSRARGGPLDFCPTCDVLVRMKAIADDRSNDAEVKT